MASDLQGLSNESTIVFNVNRNLQRPTVLQNDSAIIDENYPLGQVIQRVQARDQDINVRF